MKTCFKCGEDKPLTDFYAHPMMSDGRVGKCKTCNKKDVSANYRKNRPHYEEYEKQRFQTPERKAKAIEYQRKRRLLNPEKYKANNALSRAIGSGKLIPAPCVTCGDVKSEGHHPDYSKPLDVIWLCRKHHLAEHGKVAY